MTIESLDVVFYTCIFVIPGLITQGIIASICPSNKKSEGERFASYIGYSVFNYVFVYWSIYLILSIPKPCFFVAYTLIVLLGSAVSGFLLGFIRSKQLIRKFAKTLGINYFHSIPTSWDYVFSKQRSAYVIVTLSGGNRIAGKFDTNSFASSESDERDIYLEEEYIVENGTWSKVPMNVGVLIAKDNIVSIELFRGEDINNG